MALVLTATAITAGYIVYKKKKEANLILAGTTLDDKESITLLPLEDDVSMFEMPIGTITYYTGSYEDAAAYVKKRLSKIINLNPWLAGWLVLEKTKLKIYYNKSGENHLDVSRNFLVAEPGQIIVDKSAPFDMLVPRLLEAGAVVENNMSLIGHDKPVFKVSIIPDKNASDTNRFALVVSMSHALGDPHTYYKILNMLDFDTPVEPLTATRNTSYPDALLEKVGKEEYSYFLNALNETTTIDAKEQEKAIEAAKKKTLSDPIVTKVFYLNKDWLLKSSADPGTFCDTDVEIPRPDDETFAAHAVFASWFLKITGATVGLLPYNQRGGRLAAQDCDLGQEMAGNYTHTLLYTPADYHPRDIQLSMAVPPQLNATTADSSAREKLKFWRVLKRAPKMDDNAKVSVVAPWATAHSGKEIKLGTKSRSQQELHCMLLHTSEYNQMMAPGGMSMLLTFCVVPPNNAADAPPRAGIFCMCPQSVWKECIQPCGIVDEYIFDGQ